MAEPVEKGRIIIFIATDQGAPYELFLEYPKHILDIIYNTKVSK